MVWLALPHPCQAGTPPPSVAPWLVVTARSARRYASTRDGSAGRSIDERGLHQHPVHADRKVRCRRLWGRRLRCRIRRSDRARRHHRGVARSSACRSDWSPPRDGRGRVDCATAVHPWCSGTQFRRARRHTDARPPDGHRPLVPGRRDGRRRDAEEHPRLRNQRPRDGERLRRRNRCLVIGARRSRPRRVAPRLRGVRDLVHRGPRPHPPAPRDPPLHRRSRRTQGATRPARPQTHGATRLCGVHRQHFHLARELLPEQLSQRRARLLGRAHRPLLTRCRHTRCTRLDHRWPIRRYAWP